MVMSDYLEKINRSLTNITPNEEQIERIESLRRTARGMAASIVANVPVSREQSLAVTKLEETLMWAVKGILV
jgi:hypothetical protein